MISIAYKGCVSISWRHFLAACHCTYIQSKRYYYYLRPHDNVVMQLHERNQVAWNECTSDLVLLNWRFGKENLASWCRGIDTSNEVATGELADVDDSNFNIIKWYEWAIKWYGDWCILYAKQKHLRCKKGEANQKQQLSDYTCD